MQTNPLLIALNAINPSNDFESEIKADILKNNPDPSGDDLLSYIEENYCFTDEGTTYNPTSKFTYQNGIDFLHKHNLMP